MKEVILTESTALLTKEKTKIEQHCKSIRVAFWYRLEFSYEF